MMQNLLLELEEILKKDGNFVADDDTLQKNKIVEAALKIDPALIEILLKEENIKKHFFSKVGDVLVFDKVKFQRFVSNKQFLADSYTSFGNKIGLSDGDDGYLKDIGDVVLNWAYKDCVLEGGMTKEERGKEEIFYNTTLAPDEITRLYAPKVLTGFEKWDAEAVKKGKSKKVQAITDKDNLLIKGNNLIALHCLKKRFAGKVKLIYIDPPYNTGSDGFRYNDSFNHSTWLTFMRNRLKVAKELLRNDGVIFVQCDDTEQAYLKVLMDEIFNFKECIAVKTSTPSGVNAVNVKRGEQMFKLKEYLLFYSKESSYRFYPLLIKSNFKPQYKYRVIKENDKYKVDNLSKEMNKEELEKWCLENPDNIFSLEKNNKKAGKEVKQALKESEGKKEVMEYESSNGTPTLMYDGGVFIPLKERIMEEGGKKHFGVLISDFWDDQIFQTTNSEGGVNFNNGKKPEKLLKRIIELSTKKSDIVLDYHLGSGTTAAVAHKMGRQWIGVEQMDYIKDLSGPRIKNVIEGEKGGISKEVNWQGGGEFIYCELKKWNEQYIQEIHKAKTKTDIKKIYQEIRQEAFYRYDVDMDGYESKDFDSLSLSEQKKALCDCLDINHLYVNWSEKNDNQYKITDEEKNLSKKFYGE